ncbi:MAG: flagellar export chaperone FliS [Phycisphaerales bacterium]|nr:flagellar export chaperone FliS [Phycisphaerales bacterium]
MTPAPNNSYLRNTVLQATPERLQLMLYDGAIRFATQGREAVERRDFEQIYEKLSRAQRIVLEMQAGLRHEINPELCGRMSALYNFIHHKLVNGSMNRSVADIDDALHILKLERETWSMLVDKLARERTEVDGALCEVGRGAPAGEFEA